MDTLTNEMARRAIMDGGPFLMSGTNGTIFAANQAFCELVGYSEVELQRMGWIRLSVDNDELQADQELASQLAEGRIQSYNQWKAYRTRYDLHVKGQLLAIRYPQGEAPIEFCLCWFTPLVNGSKAALEMVTEHLKHHAATTKENSEMIGKMIQSINGHAPRSKFRAMADSIFDWGQENPKLAISIIVLFLMFKPQNILENWAMKYGWLPAQPVQIQIRDQKTGQVTPADERLLQKLDSGHAQSIANVGSEQADQGVEDTAEGSVRFVEFTTPAGNRISLPTDPDRSMLRNLKRNRWDVGEDRRIDSFIASPVRKSSDVSIKYRAINER